PVPSPSRRALHQLRVVRLRLLERLGHGECAAPADDPRVRDERRSARAGPWGAAATLFSDETGIQDDEVSGLDDVHLPTAGGILGRSGISMVRRDLRRGNATTRRIDG